MNKESDPKTELPKYDALAVALEINRQLNKAREERDASRKSV